MKTSSLGKIEFISAKVVNSTGVIYLTNTDFSTIFHTTHSLGSFDLVDDCNADIFHSLPPPQFFKWVTLLRTHKVTTNSSENTSDSSISLASIFICIVLPAPSLHWSVSLLSIYRYYHNTLSHYCRHYYRQMDCCRPLQLDIPTIQTSSLIILSSFINQLSLMQN